MATREQDELSKDKKVNIICNLNLATNFSGKFGGLMVRGGCYIRVTEPPIIFNKKKTTVALEKIV